MGDVEIKSSEAVATVTLSHPGRHNAIDARMWSALATGFSELSRDTALRCVVVRGASGQFAGGADITEFPQQRADLRALRHYHEDLIAPALRAIEGCLHPTVAAIEGSCVGGGFEIACRCDLRIATASARLGVPINRLGFPMAPAELSGLVSLAGRAVALELLLEGRLLSAEMALAKNLLTRVVPDGEIDAALSSCVDDIVAGAPLAARINKQLVRRLVPIIEPLSAEELEFAFSYHDSADHQEGIAAYLERREPRFVGR